MKRIIFILSFQIWGILTAFGQSAKPVEIAFDIVKTAEKLHYSPPAIDDAYAAKVYEGFLKQLDPSHLYLLKEDVDQLRNHKQSLDNFILTKNDQFLTEASSLFELRILASVAFLKQLKSSALSFNETASLSLEEASVSASAQELQQKWINIVKYNLLIAYHEESASETKTAAAFLNYFQKNFSSRIDQIVCQIEEKYITEGKLERFVADKYLYAISSAFDPHTVYFNPADNESFNQQLSKEALSFGMELSKNEDGNFELVQLIPGGPAWNSGTVNEGDVLTQLTDKDNKKVELDCISSSAFQKTINELDSAQFTFKKSNGSKVSLALHKRSIEVVDNIIDSYVLKGEQNIGYLYLPSFYSEESNGIQLPNGCANDIAKQLLKLKKEGIEGLIIDLRNNGGGSMLEAIRLAGIFINFGAVAITDDPKDGAVTLKDMDRGTIFSKPLVVLVNNYSASASELFAATMQDHNRGVILGENTFGKSTFQRVIPVDAHRNPNNMDRESPKGYLKLTQGKFFRVTGKSHQGTGVQVDISLNKQAQLPFHEADLPNALPNTSISKKTYYTPFPELPFAQLKALKAKRDATQQTTLIQDKEIHSIPLTFDSFHTFYQAFEEENVSEPLDSITAYKATIPSFFFEQDALTATEKEVQSRTVSAIEHDPFILDSYLILTDLIKL